MRNFYENEDEFDRLLREKLDDSSAFGASEIRSWQSLDRRLDAFRLGGSGGVKKLLFWKAGLAASVALAGFFCWKTMNLSQKAQLLEQKNAALEQTVATERTARLAEKALALDEKAADKVAAVSSNSAFEKSEIPARPTGGRNPKSEISSSAQTEAEARLFQTPSAATSSELGQKQGQKTKLEPTSSAATDAVFFQNKKAETAAAPEKSSLEMSEKVVGEDANNGKNGLKKAVGTTSNSAFRIPHSAFEKSEATDAVFFQNKKAETAAAPEKTSLELAEKAVGEEGNKAFVATDSAFRTPHSAFEKAAELAQKVDSLAVVLAKTEAEKDSIQRSAIPVLHPIEPVSRHFGRFRAGIEAVVGQSQPRAEGISPLVGQGLRAEFFVRKGLAATASAQFLSYDLATKTLLRGHHDGRPHGGGGPSGGGHHPPAPSDPDEFDLALVEARQRQRHFSLGAKWVLPTRGWLRPSLEAAAVTAFVPEYLLTYRFDEKGSGGPGGPKGPEFLAERIEKETFSNIWRAGAGLAVELSRWEIGLTAAYQKDFSSLENDRLADLFSVRAGAAFKF